MVDKFIKFMLLVSPLAYTTGIKPETFETMFFHFGVIGLFMASLLDTPKRENIPIAKEIVLFLSLCLVSAAVHTFPIFSLGAIFNLFIFCISLNIIHRYMSEPQKYYKYITWAVGINILIYLVQRYWFNFLPFEPLYALGGIFGVTPRLANYLAITTPMLPFAAWFIIPIISLIIAQIPAIVVVFGLFGVKLFKKCATMKFYKTTVLVLTSVFGIFIWKLTGHISISISRRITEIWKPMIIEICKMPFIGHGIGSYYSQVGTDPFNTYLAFIYDVGILGLVLIGYTLYRIRKYFSLEINSIAVIVLLGVSVIDYAVEIPRLWFTISFIVAAFFIKKECANVSNECIK
jgi:hypothetical protein